jgi:hypothetical protein
LSKDSYLNLKGYKEFEAENRPEGWSVWLTFALSPAAAPRLCTARWSGSVSFNPD